MADALATLARLRRLEEADARRALGEAARREADAEQMAAQARAARLREMGASAGTGLLAALAAWLPQSDRAIGAAETEARSRRLEREDAAHALHGRRAALDAVEVLAAERRKLWRRDRERRLQSRLDELGQRLRRAET